MFKPDDKEAASIKNVMKTSPLAKYAAAIDNFKYFSQCKLK